MQCATSLLCHSALAPSHHSLLFPLRPRFSSTVLPSSLSHLPFKPLHSCLYALSPLRSTATQEIVETANSGAGFVEVGYISSVHGLLGEICVKPSTDFPELRFSKPGRRWLRKSVSGKDMIEEVELVEGRGHPGRKRWILRFGGIDTVEQARQLVGSTLLVREEDRPELEEGEFYTRDLVGMRVILKETGDCVGTVVNVFDSGASDLLQVMLYPSVDVLEGAERSMQAKTGLSGSLVWVPFVEAIVPDVDMTRREMWITPPKGLLELNIRSDERSKKERRQIEWKERKKFQRRLIEAKKKLCEMEQKHVFDGLRYGEKSQRSLLADQIVGVNSKLLQQALQNIEMPSERLSLTELISAAKTKLIKSSLKLSKKCLTPCVGEENVFVNFQEKGVHLLTEGKVGIVLVVNDFKKGSGDSPDVVGSKRTEDSTFSLLQKLLSDDQKFLKMEDRACVPLLLVCPVREIQSVTRLFSNNGYFGFDTNKVWFLEEEKLPIVSSPEEEQTRHKILMKSSWEILQSPIGSGGVISLLSSHNFPENLSQVCSVNQNYVLGNASLVGFVHSCGAEIGIQFEDMESSEESFDIIFSIRFMKKLMQQMDKLQFFPILRPNSHVKMVDKKWIDVVPSSPNSYQFYCSIYSSLNTCPLDNICVMEITE
ncbi:uncharacterized protein LOC110668570 isoform X2 [Hevea brasiliensis]|uniref:uncharacterized protein LOC110668570 isoform X2 n=1 Tax=Hevea brasiliensis TaxID=3981 RepID=UPI0025D88768|nr:uncharacterized protein LOC110668570 isoform X2 [Hevea brasiliensis]